VGRTAVFAEIGGLRQFAWADLDGDGVPDAVLLDATGRMHIFINERQGQFREHALPASLASIKAIAVMDADNNGLLDVLAVQSDGALVRVSFNENKQTWCNDEVA